MICHLALELYQSSERHPVIAGLLLAAHSGTPQTGVNIPPSDCPVRLLDAARCAHPLIHSCWTRSYPFYHSPPVILLLIFCHPLSTIYHLPPTLCDHQVPNHPHQPLSPARQTPSGPTGTIAARLVPRAEPVGTRQESRLDTTAEEHDIQPRIAPLHLNDMPAQFHTGHDLLQAWRGARLDQTLRDYGCRGDGDYGDGDGGGDGIQPLEKAL